MWINSQIERKNMTGSLQNDIGHKFFLTRHSTAFDRVYQQISSCVKVLGCNCSEQKNGCEYHKNWFYLRLSKTVQIRGVYISL